MNDDFMVVHNTLEHHKWHTEIIRRIKLSLIKIYPLKSTLSLSLICTPREHLALIAVCKLQQM